MYLTFKIFKRLREQGRFLAAVRVSYVEIYNDSFFDLLRPATDPSSISITEDSDVRLAGPCLLSDRVRQQPSTL